MAEKWIGKTAVVTGSSSGIGAAIFREFLKLGIDVIGLDINIEKTQQIIDELNDVKGKGHAFHCDISNEASVDEVFTEIEQKFKFVHILINNAGIGR